MPFTVIPDLFYFFTIFPVASSSKLLKNTVMSIEADISSPAAQAQLAALAANLAGQEEKKVRMYAHTNYPSTQLLHSSLSPPTFVC